MNKARHLKLGDKVYAKNVSRTKLLPYFVSSFEVIIVLFNRVTLANPNTGELVKKNIHFKNLMKE